MLGCVHINNSLSDQIGDTISMEWQVLLLVGHQLCRHQYSNYNIRVGTSAHTLVFHILRPQHYHVSVPGRHMALFQIHEGRTDIPDSLRCYRFLFFGNYGQIDIGTDTRCVHCEFHLFECVIQLQTFGGMHET